MIFYSLSFRTTGVRNLKISPVGRNDRAFVYEEGQYVKIPYVYIRLLKKSTG